MPSEPCATSADIARIEKKIDSLLANDADEQVAGILGAIRRMLEPAWVQRGIQAVAVLVGIWLMGRLGIISGQTQADLTNAATGGVANIAAPAVESPHTAASAPDARPEDDVAPHALPDGDAGEESPPSGPGEPAP